MQSKVRNDKEISMFCSGMKNGRSLLRYFVPY